mmetsp:Transcript_97559/g.284838  ORF Transcript_97559/g.284838 Transcript_97559/m.284838 type:complete len:268 (-) Transcript_97559:677-1480(-)
MRPQPCRVAGSNKLQAPVRRLGTIFLKAQNPKPHVLVHCLLHPPGGSQLHSNPQGVRARSWRLLHGCSAALPALPLWLSRLHWGAGSTSGSLSLQRLQLRLPGSCACSAKQLHALRHCQSHEAGGKQQDKAGQQLQVQLHALQAQLLVEHAAGRLQAACGDELRCELAELGVPHQDGDDKDVERRPGVQHVANVQQAVLLLRPEWHNPEQEEHSHQQSGDGKADDHEDNLQRHQASAALTAGSHASAYANHAVRINVFFFLEDQLCP